MVLQVQSIFNKINIVSRFDNNYLRVALLLPLTTEVSAAQSMNEFVNSPASTNQWISNDIQNQPIKQTDFFLISHFYFNLLIDLI